MSTCCPTPLLAICITLVVLLVAVIAVAIAAILLVMYLAREIVNVRCLTCKAYCRKEEQPLLPLSHRTFNLLSLRTPLRNVVFGSRQAFEETGLEQWQSGYAKLANNSSYTCLLFSRM